MQFPSHRMPQQYLMHPVPSGPARWLDLCDSWLCSTNRIGDCEWACEIWLSCAYRWTHDSVGSTWHMTNVLWLSQPVGLQHLAIACAATCNIAAMSGADEAREAVDQGWHKTHVIQWPKSVHILYYVHVYYPLSTYSYIHIYVCMCICINICIYIHIYMYMYVLYSTIL